MASIRLPKGPISLCSPLVGGENGAGMARVVRKNRDKVSLALNGATSGVNEIYIAP